MKRFNVSIGTTVLSFDDASLAARLVDAFSNVTVYDRDWNGELAPSDNKVSFSFDDPSETDDNPAVRAAKAEARRYEEYFNNACREKDAQRKEIELLRNQLAAALPSATPAEDD